MPMLRVDDAWPIVVFAGIEPVSADDIQSFLNGSDEVLKRKEPHAIIVDMSQMSPVNPDMRRKVAAWLAEHQEELKKYRLGSAIVVKSNVIRGIITAIYWLQPPPYPYSICSNRDEALAWSKGIIEKI